ncbi:hypothetical protein, partial [Escherichia coli]|uniref:hypothetical protein n=1 Tax=Escherichia coli TaxID=562 RepID=UPI001BDB88F7
SYTACHIGCSSVLVEDSSTPARATNSGLENTKKPDYPSGFFCACRLAVLPFFPLHLRDFSFIFCCSQYR